MKKKNLLIFLYVLTSILLIYFLDFYIFYEFNSENFWCVEVLNFEVKFINNIKIPIHCDEGPYQTAAVSITNYFNHENPYQGRPLFVFLIALLIKTFTFVSNESISDYFVFRIAMFVIQTLIIFLSSIVFVKTINKNLNNLKLFLVIFSFISIPGIRWNIFFPSVGNITLLLFLLVIGYISRNSHFKKNSKYFYFSLGVLSLAHLTAIVYGMICVFLIILKNKEIDFRNFISDISKLLIFQFLYRILISFTKYEYFDWHKEIHNQFYWIIDAINHTADVYCQTFDTFLTCNFQTTYQYLSFFSIPIIYLLFLLLTSKMKNKNLPIQIHNAFSINSLIFIFWSFQGVYEPFRFVNYSIGYFIFLSIIYLYVFVFNKNYYLIFCLLTFEFSIRYLAPYNMNYTFPSLNYLTVFSFILFSLVLYSELSKNNLGIKLFKYKN